MKESPMPAARTERPISDGPIADGHDSGGQGSAGPLASGPRGAADNDGAQTGPICWFQGRFQPLADARISVMTHGFLYGTGIFEGIRAYWNEEQGQLYGLKLKEHYTRLVRNCKLMLMEPPGTPAELVELTVELLRRNGWREDVYVRPTVYKSTEAIGVRLHNLENDWVLVSVPFGDYVDTNRGITMGTVGWRRVPDQALPARGKITGAYVNSAFSKTEAVLNGFDEAVVLTIEGQVSEGSAANIAIVRDNAVITPPISDDILEGITRTGLREICERELKMEWVERSIDRSELYISDEVILFGTGVQVAPVVEIDHRKVGEGGIGPVGQRVRDLYFDIVRGKVPGYEDWLTPVY
jgi:branched-chain amino acid aminotransferase